MMAMLVVIMIIMVAVSMIVVMMQLVIMIMIMQGVSAPSLHAYASYLITVLQCATIFVSLGSRLVFGN